MEIVDEDHERPAARHVREHRLDGLEQAVAVEAGITGGPLANASGEALELRKKGDELRHVGSELGRRHLEWQRPHQVIEQLHPGLVGRGQLAVAAPVEHNGAGPVEAANELRHPASGAGPP